MGMQESMGAIHVMLRDGAGVWGEANRRGHMLEPSAMHAGSRSPVNGGKLNFSRRQKQKDGKGGESAGEADYPVGETAPQARAQASRRHASISPMSPFGLFNQG